MRVQANQDLAQAMESWLVTAIEGFRPRYCCEIDTISFEESVTLVQAIVDQWKAELVFLSYQQGGECPVRKQAKYRAFCDTREEFRRSIEFALSDEGTVSVADVSRFGGCLFDLSESEESKSRFCFLAAAWGEHESSIDLAGIRHEHAHFFRGN